MAPHLITIPYCPRWRTYQLFSQLEKKATLYDICTISIAAQHDLAQSFLIILSFCPDVGHFVHQMTDICCPDDRHLLLRWPTVVGQMAGTCCRDSGHVCPIWRTFVHQMVDSCCSDGRYLLLRWWTRVA
jgi:hypothetical protein